LQVYIPQANFPVMFLSGFLTKSGGGFKIDYILDPANKHLSHSFVEPSDMKNIYDAIATLDQNAKAEVELPHNILIVFLTLN
jgi:hypothetical protein